MLEWVIVIDPANSVPMPAKKDLKPSAISSTPVIRVVTKQHFFPNSFETPP